MTNETDDTCKECGQPLEPGEDWIVRDVDLLGTEASGPLGESYMHVACASEAHIQHVLEVGE